MFHLRVLLSQAGAPWLALVCVSVFAFRKFLLNAPHQIILAARQFVSLHGSFQLESSFSVMNDVNLASVVSLRFNLRLGSSLLVYDFSRIVSFGSKAHSLSLLSLARLGSALFLYDFASLRRHLS